MPPDSAATHERRLSDFAARLADAGIAAAVISQPADLFYLSGTAQPCNLLIVPGSDPILFARRFVDLAREQSAVAQVVGGAGFAPISKALEAAGVRSGKLGFELDVIPAALYRKAVGDFPRYEVVDCAPILLAQRAIKDQREIELLRRAAAAYRAVHETIVERLQPGCTELEIAAAAERALRLQGHEGMVSYRRWDGRLPPEGAIASGPNLATISGGPITISGVGLDHAYPLGASRRRLRAGDLFNIDLGLNVAGYHGDVARTYSVGEPSERIRELAVAVREIEDEIIAAVVPGRSAEEIYQAGVAAAEARGVIEVFQGHSGTHGPYVGHGLGLELDEPPVLGPGVTAPLAEGMVLAIEPKLISPEFGAVNLEDDVVVTKTGAEVFESVPRSVFVVDRGNVQALTPCR